MIQSMTAFARVETQQDWGEAAWEIRTVNHRYLDLNLKLPEAFRKYELPWRDILKSKLKRGKVECTLVVKSMASSSNNLALNEPLANQLIALSEQLGSLAKSESQIKPIDILRWPEVVIAKQQEISLESPLTELIEQAANQLVEARAREGQACVKVMAEKLAHLRELQQKAKAFGPKVEAAFKEKIETKLSNLSIEVEPNRFEQELVLFLQKVDVTEELDRLDVHIQEVERTLASNGPVGRRLDFMMQELNREANTLASKSPDSGLTQVAVEIKVCIEQLREQIQNLE